MFAIEHISYIETHHYQIVDYIMCCYPDEMVLTLIFHEEKQKYNYYIVFYEFKADNIVKNYKPRPLEEAQIAFPKYNLNEQNYGF